MVYRRVTAFSLYSYMVRDNRIRLSDDEKRVLELTQETVYDENVPLGVVVARACRSLLADDDSGGDTGVVL